MEKKRHRADFIEGVKGRGGTGWEMHTQDAIQIDPVHNAGLCIRTPYNCASNHSTHRTPEHVKNKNGTSKRTEQGRLTHGRQKGKKNQWDTRGRTRFPVSYVRSSRSLIRQWRRGLSPRWLQLFPAVRWERETRQVLTSPVQKMVTRTRGREGWSKGQR